MDYKDKEIILLEAKDHIGVVRFFIKKTITEIEKWLQESEATYRKLPGDERAVKVSLMMDNEKRINELGYLEGSPYFVRCDVIFKDGKDPQSLYFGKFSFDNKSIYSWVAPASSIRFENPGDVSYKLPNGALREAKLLRKDNFMIAGGDIKFLSSESINTPRELIHQEYFSRFKTGFALPEIVAQMEKAQDQVIRAHHIGPFLISGPAGSGKTTLALHRVAYLIQSPDLSHLYKNNSIIVFVQDTGTKNYFSQLLPELGINNVLITTFSEWAFSILDIKANYAIRFGDSENDKDLYEFQKLQAIEKIPSVPYSKNMLFSLLEKIYNPYFNDYQKQLFQKQKAQKILDRIDVTLLMRLYYETNGALGIVKDDYVEQKNGSYRKVRRMAPLKYSLVVIDEFQNYLPKQLQIIKTCINPQSESMLYVGDMAQQVQLGTIKNWDDIGENIKNERKVILHKVYRNTKNILQYVKRLGYPIELPEGLSEGKDVIEKTLLDKNAELNYIKEEMKKSSLSRIGILAKEQEYLVDFKKAFLKNGSVHVMTMNEAQGVEFEIVFLVGINKNMFSVPSAQEASRILIEEKKKVNKDLLYIALTRAISELHVLGAEDLKQSIDI